MRLPQLRIWFRRLLQRIAANNRTAGFHPALPGPVLSSGCFGDDQRPAARTPMDSSADSWQAGYLWRAWGFAPALVPAWSQRFDRLAVESLESRELLSGNVEVAFRGDAIWLTGDAAANSLNIGISDGDLVLTGSSGTTVNGAGNSLVLRNDATTFAGPLHVRLGDGNDTFTVDGAIRLERGLHVWAGAGDDSIGFQDNTIAGATWVWGEAGNDQVAIDSVDFTGPVYFLLGSGNDTLAFRDSSTTGDLLAVLGQGEDGLSLDKTDVGRSLLAVLGEGSDTVNVVDSSIGRHAIVVGEGGDDFVSVEDSQIRKEAILTSQGGSDAVRLIGTSKVGGNLLGIGGRGGDQFQVDSSVTVGKRRIVSGQEGSQVPTAFVAARLTAAESGLNSRVEDAFAVFGTTPTIAVTLADADVANTDLIESRPGDFISRDATFTVKGQTTPNATVQVARDGDNVFDDGSGVADASGNFSINVQLTNTLQNHGRNALVVRATGPQGGSGTDDLAVHFAVGTVVRMQTGLGFFDVELLDTAAPVTVDNFLNYLARYESTIVHRSVDSPNVVQGGGFIVQSGTGTITRVDQDAPIANEFSANHPNIRGSIAMARSSALNSATSEWFINVANNPALDNVAGGNQYAVFGYVVGKGLEIVDQIANLTTFDIAALTGQGALVTTPLQGYTQFSTSLSGTVSTTTGSTSVTGVGTSFTTQIPADNRIRIGGQVYTVATILSDTQLTLATNAVATVSGVVAQVNARPQATQYVVVNRISDVLGAPTVALSNTLASLDENASTVTTRVVAQINVTNNDSPGPNNLSLHGEDASSFEIAGNQLLLRAGVTLDFETNPVLDVTVDVDDPQSAGTPDASVAYRLQINNVDE